MNSKTNRRPIWASLIRPLELILILGLVSSVGCEKRHEPGITVDWSWPVTPIHVYAEPDIVEDWGKELRAAVRAWNGEAGCGVFALSDVPAAVRIEHGGSHATLRGGTWARLSSTGSPLSATVKIYNMTGVGPDISGAAYRTLVHELGRVLGYGDDPQRWSWMSRGAAGYDSLTQGGPPFRITDKDRKELKARYCP